MCWLDCANVSLEVKGKSGKLMTQTNNTIIIFNITSSRLVSLTCCFWHKNYLVHTSISLNTSRVVQWSKALHFSARGVTKDPGLIPASIMAGCDRGSHRAAHSCPIVIWVRGGFDWGNLFLTDLLS